MSAFLVTLLAVACSACATAITLWVAFMCGESTDNEDDE